MTSVTIEWLSKWQGFETVLRSRIKEKGELTVGKEVNVLYRSTHYKARIVNIKKPGHHLHSREKKSANVRPTVTSSARTKLARARSKLQRSNPTTTKRVKTNHQAKPLTPARQDEATPADKCQAEAPALPDQQTDEQALQPTQVDPPAGSWSPWSADFEEEDSGVAETVQPSQPTSATFQEPPRPEVPMSQTTYQPPPAQPTAPYQPNHLTGTYAPTQSNSVYAPPTTYQTAQPRRTDYHVAPTRPQPAYPVRLADAWCQGAPSVHSSPILGQLCDLTREVLSQNQQILQQNRELLQRIDHLSREQASLREEVKGLRSGDTACRPPVYKELDDDVIEIGCGGATTTMARITYMRAFDSAKNAKDLVLHLLGDFFTVEELARSNVNGGDVFNGREWVTKDALRTDPKFRAMMAQVEVQYPGSTATRDQQKQLRQCINNKCRKAASKLSRR
ncbi:proteoglycan 4-like [Lytechinus pictus]|uniref:proteoglycan 4-like n=1 Tax=Lytechinus pictus TaxID=7653 RepID=UPI0030BA1228